MMLKIIKWAIAIILLIFILRTCFGSTDRFESKYEVQLESIMWLADGLDFDVDSVQSIDNLNSQECFWESRGSWRCCQEHSFQYKIIGSMGDTYLIYMYSSPGTAEFNDLSLIKKTGTKLKRVFLLNACDGAEYY